MNKPEIILQPSTLEALGMNEADQEEANTNLIETIEEELAEAKSVGERIYHLLDGSKSFKPDIELPPGYESVETREDAVMSAARLIRQIKMPIAGVAITEFDRYFLEVEQRELMYGFGLEGLKELVPGRSDKQYSKADVDIITCALSIARPQDTLSDQGISETIQNIPNHVKILIGQGIEKINKIHESIVSNGIRPHNV